MPHIQIPFPWYLLIYEDDETPLTVSAAEFDMLVVFTDLEFASLYGQRTGCECRILEVSEPASMIDIFEQVIEAEAMGDDRPVSHVCFDPIEPSRSGSEVSAISIESLLEGLKKAT